MQREGRAPSGRTSEATARNSAPPTEQWEVTEGLSGWCWDLAYFFKRWLWLLLFVSHSMAL